MWESHNEKRKRVGCRKHNRGVVFRKWLLETFEDVFQDKETVHVLDVAGGKGGVAIPMVLAGYRTTIIDPRICDLSKNATVKNLQYHIKMKNTKTYMALKEKLGEDTLETTGLPMPDEIREYFLAPPASKQNQHQEKEGGGSSAMLAAKGSASIIVGMHPDEATEHIVDVALQMNLPFAVVPCCVFPRENTFRVHPRTGGAVQTYEDFVEYLCAKAPTRISTATLDFEGRNIVVFGR